MATIPEQVIGDKLVVTMKLRIKNQVNPNLEDPYVLPASFDIYMTLGGQTVKYSDGKVAVTPSTDTDIVGTFPHTVSILMTANSKAELRAIVHDLTSGDEPQTFRVEKAINLIP